VLNPVHSWAIPLLRSAQAAKLLFGIWSQYIPCLKDGAACIFRVFNLSSASESELRMGFNTSFNTFFLAFFSYPLYGFTVF
jgi:hypothetical protein